MTDKVIVIYDKGFEDGRNERDYDPQSHNETYDLQCELKSLRDELMSVAGTLDSLVKSGHVSHHPQVELDALTDGMRSVAKGES